VWRFKSVRGRHNNEAENMRRTENFYRIVETENGFIVHVEKVHPTGDSMGVKTWVFTTFEEVLHNLAAIHRAAKNAETAQVNR
jgi:hypothetical protein